MKIIETKVYQFDELNENAKQNAIENYRNNNDDVFLDFFKDDAKEQIENAGFKGNVSLSYSLSYCQGDGLSFSCDSFDKLNDLFIEVLGTEKQKTIDCIINNCSFENKGNNGRYSYSSKKDICFELESFGTNYDKTNIENIVSQVETKIQDLYMDLCKDLEKQGYLEIEYQNSDEYITENLISNEYEFTENGNIF